MEEEEREVDTVHIWLVFSNVWACKLVTGGDNWGFSGVLVEVILGVLVEVSGVFKGCSESYWVFKG